MDFRPPSHHKSLEVFSEHWAAIGDQLGEQLAGHAQPQEVLGRSAEVFGRRAGNRFAIHPMEGWDGTAEGGPSEWTLRRWENFGASGADLIWGGEAFAVHPDGRANPNQLFLREGDASLDDLRQLLAALKRGRERAGLDPDGLITGLQLTHSGRFCRPRAALEPRVPQRHPVLDERFGVEDDALLSDAELVDLRERYLRAAELASEAGFDFVDVKACHGYLMHELLSARHRPGPYGGELESRWRLLEEILTGVRERCPQLGLGVRLSAADTFPHAKGPDGLGAPVGIDEHRPYTHAFGVDADQPLQFDLEEPRRLIAHLVELGVAALNVTVGSPYYCPHLQRPAAYPPSDGYKPHEDPLLNVGRHIALTRALKASFPELPVVGSGYSYLQEWLPHVGAFEVAEGHVDYVGLGRMVLSYPDLPLDVLRGAELQRKRICRTFSDCTTAPRKGKISGCYPLDPTYRALPEAKEIAAIRRATAQGAGQ